MFQGDSVNCFYKNLIQTDFDRAMRRLHDMDLVCFSDDMDECMAHLRRMMHLPQLSASSSTTIPSSILQSHSPSTTMGERSNTFRIAVEQALRNQTLRELVESANKADITLYKWARQNYKQPYQETSTETVDVE